jgi:hypothetical protein
VEPETEKKKKLEEFREKTEMLGEFQETLGKNGMEVRGKRKVPYL